MKLKNALRKDPPTTDPKLNLRNLETGRHQFDAELPLLYHYTAFPEMKKLTKLIHNYMYLSGTAFPI